MTTLYRARRKKTTPHAASESAIYAGRELAGTVIVQRKGRVTATDASGKCIGTFATDRAAMAAIHAAARSRRTA